MTIDHRDLLDVALDWLIQVQQSPEDGVLRERLATWLASDEANLIAYRQAEKTWRVTGMLTSQSAERAEALALPSVRPRRRQRRLVQSIAAAAACCTLAVVIQDMYPSLRSDVHTSTGERREVVLPDGSQLTLGAQSAIALDFNDGRREVRILAGQVYFKVAKDPAHPFRVFADDLSVTVTGTAFNVDSMRQRVNVAEGAVRVAAPRTAEVSLTPGHGVELGQGGVFQEYNEPAGQVASWRQGRLILRRERIADVIDVLRPYCRNLIVLRDSELGEMRITGVYDLGKPTDALRAIVKLHGGELQQLGPVLLIGRAD